MVHSIVQLTSFLIWTRILQLEFCQKPTLKSKEHVLRQPSEKIHDLCLLPLYCFQNIKAHRAKGKEVLSRVPPFYIT